MRYESAINRGGTLRGGIGEYLGIMFIGTAFMPATRFGSRLIYLNI